jgi:hypothetical protein
MAGRRWQFSMRSIIFVLMIAGPLVGALAGTFGHALQEVLILLVVVALLSSVLAVLAVTLAVVIMSPLFLLESALRYRSRPKVAPERPDAGPSAERLG